MHACIIQMLPDFTNVYIDLTNAIQSDNMLMRYLLRSKSETWRLRSTYFWDPSHFVFLHIKLINLNTTSQVLDVYSNGNASEDPDLKNIYFSWVKPCAYPFWWNVLLNYCIYRDLHANFNRFRVKMKSNFEVLKVFHYFFKTQDLKMTWWLLQYCSFAPRKSEGWVSTCHNDYRH